MAALTLEIPETVLLSSGQSREDFLREARFLLAAKLFERGGLSSGKAAEFCAMRRAEFLLALGRAGIPAIDLDDEEMGPEFADA